jgi:fumarate reductase flavoprotein subunit
VDEEVPAPLDVLRHWQRDHHTERNKLMAEKFDVSYDMVVVGGGGSGLSCAIQAAKDGLTVAVLEKKPELGGNTAFAEGHASFESVEQVKRGITVTKDQAYEALLDYSHWNAKPALVARYVENADQTVLKMLEEGVVYHDVLVMESDGGLPTWHIPEGEMSGLLNVFKASIQRLGIEVFLETRASSLITSASGAVVGVVATDKDGQEVRIGAGAVALAGGGFGSNAELLAKYTSYSHPEKIFPFGSDCATGDGLLMAEAVGGHPFREIGTSLLGPLMRGKTITSHTNCAGLQPYYWADAKGRRFCNEIVALNFGHAGQTIAQTPDGFIWTVIDQATVRHLVEEKCDIGMGIYIVAGSKLDTLPVELEADVAAGLTAFKSDTLEGLAAQIGVDPAGFVGDIVEYNEACATGKDTKFLKPAHLRPVAEGPFYALKMEVGILVTTGGIDIDEYMRVIDAGGKAIEGLYAVGCDAGGLYGESYCMTVNGASAGFALTSGWLAADHAAELIKAKQPA